MTGSIKRKIYVEHIRTLSSNSRVSMIRCLKTHSLCFHLVWHTNLQCRLRLRDSPPLLRPGNGERHLDKTNWRRIYFIGCSFSAFVAVEAERKDEPPLRMMVCISRYRRTKRSQLRNSPLTRQRNPRRIAKEWTTRVHRIQQTMLRDWNIH